MSKVDDRVVKMSFDNKDFESNAKQSLTTLGRLKDAVAALPESASTGLNNVLGKLTGGDLLKIGALTAGITTIKKGIEAIADPIEALGQKAIGVVNNVISTTITKIKEGGWNRAMKIEDAKFLLKGLKLDVDTFMDAANYAVTDTAYSLDAAASAAAQLGAAGIDDADKLKYSLRSISGFAAVTNRSFEEIAYHWTSMAGLGRVTGMELTTLGMKGINVTAKLAEYLGKTQEEIRIMASKGEISFDTFAKAMDEAFGEHAKDANETFQGITANIGAALSRIGELFATPIIQNIVPALQGVKSFIDSIKEGIINTSVVEKWTNLLIEFANAAKTALNNLHDAIVNSKIIETAAYGIGIVFDKLRALLVLINNGFGNTQLGSLFESIFKSLSRPINNIIELIRYVMNQFSSVFNFDDITQFVTSISIALNEFTYGLKFSDIELITMSQTFRGIFDLVRKVGKVIGDAFNLKRYKLASTAKEIKKFLYEFVVQLRPTAEIIERAKNIAKNVLTILFDIVDMAKSVIDYVAPLALQYLPQVGQSILFIIEKVTDLGVSIANAIKNSELIKTVWGDIKKIIDAILGAFDQINASFVDIFITDKDDGTSFFSKIQKFFNSIWDTINNGLFDLDVETIDFGPVKEFFGNIIDTIMRITKLDGLNAASQNATFIELLLEWLYKIFTDFTGIFTNVNSQGLTPFQQFFIDLGKGISNIYNGFVNLDKDHLDFLLEVLKLITDIILKLINVSTILTLAFTVVIETGKLEALIARIVAIVAALAGLFTGDGFRDILKVFIGLDTLKDAVLDFNNISTLLDSIAKTILAFTVFVLMINATPSIGKIFAGVGALLLLITAIGGIMVGLMAFSQKLKLWSNKTGSLFKVTSHSSNGNEITDKSKQLLPGFLGKSSPFTSIALALLEVSIGVTAITIGLAFLSNSIGEGEFGKFAAVTGIVLGTIAIISGLLIGLSAAINHIFNGYSTDAALVLVSLGASILLISLAFKNIALSLTAMSLLAKPEDIAAATVCVSVIIAVIGIFLSLLSFISTGENKFAALEGAASVFLALSGMAIGMIGFATAVAILAKTVDEEKLKTVEKLMTTMGIIMGSILVVVSIVSIIGGALGPASGAIMALVAFSAAVSLAIVMLALAINQAILGSIFKTLTKFIIAIDDLLTLARDINENDAVSIGKKLTLIIKGFVLGLIDNLVDIAKSIQQNSPKIITAMIETIRDLIIAFAVGVDELFSLDTLSKLRIPIISGIAKILVFIKDIIVGCKDLIIGCFTTVFQLVLDFLSYVIDNVDWSELIAALRRLVDFVVEEVQKFVDERLTPWTEWAVEKIIEFFNAASAELNARKDEIAEGCENIKEVIKSVMDSVLNKPDWLEHLETLGKNAVDGFIRGIKGEDSLNKLANAGQYMGQQTELGYRRYTKTESPSKLFQKLGNYLVEGFTLGIKELSGKAQNAVTDLVNLDGLSGIKSAASNIFETLGLDADLSPVISPTLDLSNIVSGLGDMNSLFDSGTINGIFNAQAGIMGQANMNDLMDNINSKYSDMMGRNTYSIKQSSSAPQPINVEVRLEGDAKDMLRVIQKEDRRYTLSHGHSAFARS